MDNTIDLTLVNEQLRKDYRCALQLEKVCLWIDRLLEMETDLCGSNIYERELLEAIFEDYKKWRELGGSPDY